MAVTFTGKETIEAVLKEMTLEEKAQLVTGRYSYGTAEIDRLGIPSATFVDNGCGVNLRQLLTNLLNRGKLNIGQDSSVGMGRLSELTYIMDNLETPENLTEEERKILDALFAYLKEQVPSGLPSAFPVASLLASSWDEQVIYDCAVQAGREACAFGVDVLLGTPCVNIQRDPRGGRGFEGFSEDPYLTAALAPAYVKGVQEQGVLADVKHFAMNNQETDRKTVNVLTTERVMREIYLPGFEACVKDGGVKNVMTSYNYINGTAAAHNRHLIEDILRGEWGFDGLVVSDWGGVYDQVLALDAGNDLCMPGPREIDPIVQAVKDGTLQEERLDAACRNFLHALAEMPVMKGREYQDKDPEAAQQAAYNAAAAGIVLLENKAQTLPLKDPAGIAFYGSYSERFCETGVGSGHVFTDRTSSMINSVKQQIGDGKVTFEETTDSTDTVIVTLFSAGQEGADRPDITLEGEAQKTYNAALDAARSQGARLVVVLNIAGPVDLNRIREEADAILLVYFPGMEGGHAAADILLGRINPSGKLAQTFPKRLADVPSYGNFPGENRIVNYGEGLLAGYRYYDMKQIEPLYPFGYGLSYTQFTLSDLTVPADVFAFDEMEVFPVSVTVTNTGDVPGAEVVQLYISDAVSTLFRPVKELKGFAKVYLEPGESRRVTLPVTKTSLQVYDEAKGRWVIEPGRFILQIGTSSRDIVLQTQIMAKGINPYAYGKDTEYAQIVKDPRSLKVLLDVVPEEILSYGDICRQTVYIAFSYSLADAFRDHVESKVGRERSEQLLEAVCEKLARIDVSDGLRYVEKEVY